MLTALVIDAAAAGRRQVAGLLALGGWQVHEAADAESAAQLHRVHDVDLVVTAGALPGVTGPALLHRLRAAGSTARFLVVAPAPTAALRAEAAAAGALATLAGPVDAGLLLDLVQRRSCAPVDPEGAQEMVEVDDLHDADLDADLMDRLQDMYSEALPSRMSAIAHGMRDGNSAAVASAAQTLAGPSGQLGHPEVESMCQAIAADARRGILAHDLVAQLAALTRGGCRSPRPSRVGTSSGRRPRPVLSPVSCPAPGR